MGASIAPGPQPVQMFSSRNPNCVPTRRAYRYSFSLIEWPPQHTTMFGASPTCSARALRKMENTRLVICVELSRSRCWKRPALWICPFTKRMSRSTANRLACSARIIRPSTKASSGGLINSSFTPRSRRSTLISKFSKRDSSSLLLSVRLPELRTASEQLRNS
ncbi:Uncharacterised protein [Salmonella enterica subsp. enterica serovar Bovismorbificans]|uniref:Uncharacterized protein n=1 Tax=Salmonella enterica subsp. enterica serovar Bovismorbificans TaxID=58097 RepID=A0A655CI02_SALET|nr:Uncharacterised protein [Salmonella enterica subsp. enterica serovar Bovismorbificans]CNU19068.1 Uncharacterised protein [Salmonella enterica subsp. enterica serovar Bovismorbificans]CPR45284.1 Uncharacterised protein [Salmonella enterica subsp. enterica serovar Bovismorbificans]CPR59760.1 Uncharacterised protein [Salmonella enterica subsp. enterica serovar Bovismorbificans]